MRFDSLGNDARVLVIGVRRARDIVKALTDSTGWSHSATKGRVTVAARPAANFTVEADITYCASTCDASDNETPDVAAKSLIPLAQHSEMEVTAVFGDKSFVVDPDWTEAEHVVTRYHETLYG